MDNLTSILLAKNNQYNIKELTHSSNIITFLDGSEQRYQSASMPSLNIEISYTNINEYEFKILSQTFENNIDSAFLIDFPDNIDIRSELLNATKMNVFKFVDFQFELDSRINFLTGKIILSSTSFYNTTEYSDNLSPYTYTYTPSTSTNLEFMSILEQIKPQRVTHKYNAGVINNRIGGNISTSKGKSLRRAYELDFVVNEHYLLKILTYFRKKGNKLGTFGILENGYGVVSSKFYEFTDTPSYTNNTGDIIYFREGKQLLLCRGDYYVNDFELTAVVDGVYSFSNLPSGAPDIGEKLNSLNVRFNNDSFDYSKVAGHPNLYYLKLELIEVK